MATKKVVICAVGGPTCSGKTTLASFLSSALPNSVIVHQDDFAPNADLLPLVKLGEDKVQDWDDPDGAIDWAKQRETIHYLKTHHGAFPPSHSSHDHLNVRIPVEVSTAVQDEWRDKLATLPQDVCVVILDGFLAFWDKETVKDYDLRFFVREDQEVLKRRRQERNGYYTADGDMWKDPPLYWEHIVWPAYLKAHSPLFVGNDPIHGAPDPSVIDGLEVLEAREKTLSELLDRTCSALYDYINAGKSAETWKKP